MVGFHADTRPLHTIVHNRTWLGTCWGLLLLLVVISISELCFIDGLSLIVGSFNCRKNGVLSNVCIGEIHRGVQINYEAVQLYLCIQPFVEE